MSILSIISRFQTQEDCIIYLENKRWKNGVICPYCKSCKTSKHNEKNRSPRHQCQSCSKSFTVFVGTIFESSKLPIQKWLLAIALISEAKKGISAMQISRNLDITYKTAWSICHKIRKAMKQTPDFLAGLAFEMDETYVKTDDKDDDFTGGLKRGRGSQNNTAIAGIKAKGGDIKARVMDDVSFNSLMDFAKNSIQEGGELHTDEFRSYSKFKNVFNHKTVNHKREYVTADKITTNGLEGFWSLLKRGIKGQFHHISKAYLQNYIDEFCFRYNARKLSNNDMFESVVNKMLVV